jgi:hypothetical protein
MTPSPLPRWACQESRTRTFAHSQFESGRILVTLDADFGNILRYPTAGTPGVIPLKIHPPTEEAIREQIHKITRSSQEHSARGMSCCFPRRRDSHSKLSSLRELLRGAGIPSRDFSYPC